MTLPPRLVHPCTSSRNICHSYIKMVDDYLILRYIVLMRVITKRRITEFNEKYPDSKNSLETWYKIVRKTDFNSFSDVRKVFNSSDKVDKFTVFNISGNKYRLIAAIHYNSKMVYIRHILTHKEYDKNKWRD